jgi:hypothetical protein
MALGGGTFLTQNKVLPGRYINYVSRKSSSVELSERGVLAMPMYLNWGPEGAVYTVEPGDFQKNSMRLFGYMFNAPEMLPLREIFSTGIRQLKIYRLCGETQRAVCAIDGNTIATAKYGGTRGNALKLRVAANVDDPALWDVKTYMDGEFVELQSALANAGALKDSDWVIFNKSAELAATAGAPFEGGEGGTVTGMAFQNALDAFEGHVFHALGCPVADDITTRLFVEYTKRMRDDVGDKFVLAAYQAVGDPGDYSADYFGVVSVNNEAVNTPDVPGAGPYALVYWVAGILAACKINESNTNRKYNGELEIANLNLGATALEKAIRAGKFMLHSVDAEARVLDDINTFVSITDEQGEDFQSNQTIRVLDQVAVDVGNLFCQRKLGKTPNDPDGRIDFKKDIVGYLRKLEGLRAITEFDPETVDVQRGEKKKAVIADLTELNVVNCMAQLYMTIAVV